MTLSLFILAGIVSVDRFIALHMGISRPFIVAIIVGLLTSNITYAFYAGVMIEIFGLIDIQVGTRLTREDSFLAYVVTVLIGMGYIISVSKLLLLILTMLVLMYPAGHTEELVRKFNRVIFLKKGVKPSAFLLASGVAVSFLRGVIVYPLGVYIGIAFLRYFNEMFNTGSNLKVYMIFLSVFLSGYLLRFLSFKSVYKYIVFLSGLFVGWLLI